jgi:hypothetical protein
MLVLLVEGIYEIYRLDGLRWHDIHIKSHDDRFSVYKLLKGTHTHTPTKKQSPKPSLYFFSK